MVDLPGATTAPLRTWDELQGSVKAGVRLDPKAQMTNLVENARKQESAPGSSDWKQKEREGWKDRRPGLDPVPQSPKSPRPR